MTSRSERQPVVIGIDFGTLSGRAVVVRVADGAELGSAVHEYPHGVMDDAPAGQPARPAAAGLGAAGARGLRRRAARRGAEGGRGQRASPPTMSSGSAPTSPPARCCRCWPTARRSASCPSSRDRPHAYVKLWKHHAAQPQADRINALAHERGEPWIGRYGGRLSSEWELAKGLQLLEEDPEVYAAWTTGSRRPTGSSGSCAAATSATPAPPATRPSTRTATTRRRDFLGRAGPATSSTSPTDKVAQPLGAARRRGRRPDRRGGRAGPACAAGIAVAVGNVDAHVTAPAARAIEPGQMLAMMGTSTCHVMNSDALAEVPGHVRRGRRRHHPRAVGLRGRPERRRRHLRLVRAHRRPAGVRASAPPPRDVGLHEYLTALAARQPVGAHGLVALDWHSGNRSVLVDHELSGLVVGLTLGTRPEDVYRALLEATAFGTRMIVESFEAAGVPVRELVVAGGLIKNAFLMQIYADVTRRPLSLLGVRAGPGARLGDPRRGRRRRPPGRRRGGRGDGPQASRPRTRPDERRAAAYDALYAEYATLHDYFGARRQRRDAPAAADQAGGDAAVTSPSDRRTRSPPCGDEVSAAARRAGPVRPGRLDRGQRVRPGAGSDLLVIKPSGVDYDELAPDTMILCDLDGDGRRGRPHARPATPPRTPTSTGRCPRSAASCTPTRPTRRPGRPGASRSRAC